MIKGNVSSRYEAVVPLELRGPSGVEVAITAIIDSGFTGALTLPSDTVLALGLVRQPTGGATLADGSTTALGWTPPAVVGSGCRSAAMRA